MEPCGHDWVVILNDSHQEWWMEARVSHFQERGGCSLQLEKIKVVCCLKTHSSWAPVREQFLYVNRSLFLYSFVLTIITVTLSDLIVVSSKFFLFLLMIPAFCPTRWKR